jgi:hypothetical protein
MAGTDGVFPPADANHFPSPQARSIRSTCIGSGRIDRAGGVSGRAKNLSESMSVSD